jgi:hypothetical protein
MLKKTPPRKEQFLCTHVCRYIISDVWGTLIFFYIMMYGDIDIFLITKKSTVGIVLVYTIHKYKIQCLGEKTKGKVWKKSSPGATDVAFED